MRKYIFISILLLLFSCDSGEGLNCFQAAGDRVEKEFELDPFTTIVVEERVQLILKQGPQQKVVIGTGENLLNDINISVQDGELNVFNDNGCNLVRDYNITQVYVTSPNITQIRNASGYEIQSDGVLGYPSLSLISEDLELEDQYHKDGDFRLELDVDELNITGNGLSNYFLSGNVNTLNLEILEGDARFEGRELIIQDLNLYQRGTNKVIVNPQQSIRGQILSTGDVIAVNRPPVVEVEELYKGRLIFEE
ncbi:MAG: hypothetical protein CL868_10225 [Cytophagaceae bacterium]|nr:hypothetical protein [Cytophagaceae bacterium]